MARAPGGDALSPQDGGARRADWAAHRDRILAAAQESFARQGYRGTRTSDVARAAGVAEYTVFRHFGTKASLFDAAVNEPLRALIDALVERRRRAEVGESMERATFSFFDELLEALSGRSDLLIAALSASVFEDEVSQSAAVPGAFTDLLSYLEQAMDRHRDDLGDGMEPALAARAMLGLLLGVTLGDRVLFASGRPDPAALSQMLARFATSGLAGSGPTQSRSTTTGA